MTDNTAESELTQRKVTNEESEAKETEVKEEPKEPPKPKTREDFDAAWRYYWYKFRYYHFKVADTIDFYVSAACLWLINLYFRLFMGIGPEPPSALTEN